MPGGLGILVLVLDIDMSKGSDEGPKLDSDKGLDSHIRFRFIRFFATNLKDIVSMPFFQPGSRPSANIGPLS